MSKHVSNIIMVPKLVFGALRDKKLNLFTKKIAKIDFEFGVIFCDFLVNKFDFLSLRAPKTNFGTIIMLETCSGTSNYPRDILSCR